MGGYKLKRRQKARATATVQCNLRLIICSCFHSKPDLHLLLITEGVIGDLDKLESFRAAALVRVFFSDQELECPPYLYHHVSLAAHGSSWQPLNVL